MSNVVTLSQVRWGSITDFAIKISDINNNRLYQLSINIILLIIIGNNTHIFTSIKYILSVHNIVLQREVFIMNGFWDSDHYGWNLEISMKDGIKYQNICLI